EWTGGDLASFLAPLDALFVRLAHRIDRRLLDLAPRLRWVCSPTTGHLHIDEGALASRGVKVLSLRGERTFLETIRATPEHTFGGSGDRRHRGRERAQLSCRVVRGRRRSQRHPDAAYRWRDDGSHGADRAVCRRKAGRRSHPLPGTRVKIAFIGNQGAREVIA